MNQEQARDMMNLLTIQNALLYRLLAHQLGADPEHLENTFVQIGQLMSRMRGSGPFHVA